MKILRLFVLICSVSLFIGCGGSDPLDPSRAGKGQQKSISKEYDAGGSEYVNNNFNPFYIYKDKGSRGNHFIPSGFMGSVKCINFNDAWMENCYDGKTCIKIIYDVECSSKDQSWGGIFWQNPANNWGRRKGGFDLIGAQKLTFWAKGEKGGEQIQEFIMGGIEGDYSDTDKAVIGPVILSNEWRQYTIDLRGSDLSYISGGFAWTTDNSVNTQSCIFYLDEVRYE